MMEVMRPLVPFDPWLTETVRMLKGAWTFDPKNCDEKKHAHALRKVGHGGLMVAATSPQSHGCLYRTGVVAGASLNWKHASKLRKLGNSHLHASENTPHLHNSPKHFSGGSTRFV